MKIKTTFGIAMIAALMMTVAVNQPNNAFAEKSVVDEITGSFKGADFIHNAEGIAKVVTYDDWSQVLQFGNNFKSTPGPDLYVYLATDTKATEFVDLGILQSSSGAQEYTIPVGTDLNKYDKILIWCKAFGVLFGSAELPEYTASLDSKDNVMQKEESISEPKIPEWVKNAMKWFVEGQITEDEMISALQFLIQDGIINVKHE